MRNWLLRLGFGKSTTLRGSRSAGELDIGEVVLIARRLRVLLRIGGGGSKGTPLQGILASIASAISAYKCDPQVEHQLFTGDRLEPGVGSEQNYRQRICECVLHYLVEWSPTLEPRDLLGHARELVDEFEVCKRKSLVCALPFSCSDPRTAVDHRRLETQKPEPQNSKFKRFTSAKCCKIPILLPLLFQKTTLHQSYCSGVLGVFSPYPI